MFFGLDVCCNFGMLVELMYLTLQNSSFIKQISYTIEDKMETMCGWEMGVQ